MRNCLLIASHAQADGRKNPICNRPRQETTRSCLPVTVEVHASIETCFCSSARPTSSVSPRSTPICVPSVLGVETTDRFVCLEASSLLAAIITYSFGRYASQAHISGESSAAGFIHIEEDRIILFRSVPEVALKK